MDLRHWRDKVHALAKEKGWWDPRPDIDTVVCNLHGELSEAWEEYRAAKSDQDLLEIRYGVDGKPEGFVVELADFMIRTLDACGGMGIDMMGVSLPSRPELILRELSVHIPSEISELHRLCDDFNTSESAISLLSRTSKLIRAAGADPEHVIRIKHKYNKTRPYRHGNKRA